MRQRIPDGTWAALTVALAWAASGGAAAAGDALITKDAGGVIRVTPYTVDSAYENTAWTTAMQDAFWTRSNIVINAQGSSTSYGTPYFESEKQAYPKAMLSYIWGVANANSTSITAAKNFLKDNARYDTGDVGASDLMDLVDLYPSFTLKGQMPKYFFFGTFSNSVLGTGSGYLDYTYPSGATGEDAGWGGLTYLARMRSAMNEWMRTDPLNAATQIDPLNRANPYYVGPPSGGWTCHYQNSWVDIRTTDNLKSMRETSVYLSAQETGNTTIFNLYAGRIRQAAITLFRTGQSEWDSENYWAWSIGPYLTLRDYATDPGVKKQAKANLDYFMCGGGLKYLRGGFGGPTKRDYGGGNVVFGAGAAHTLYQYFGGPVADAAPETANGIHPLLSSYRPPMAAVGLATKNWGAGHTGAVELINTKPSYSNWADPGSPQEVTTSETWETLYFGSSYYLGSCVSRAAISDVGPFKLVANNAARGADFFVASSGTSYNTKRQKDEMGQYQNRLIWLRPNGVDSLTSFQFQAPKTATLERDDAHGVWYFRLQDDQTWIAVRPINLTYGSAAAGTGSYVNEINHTANQVGGTAYFGFALEVGETGSFASYTAFKDAVVAETLGLAQVASGVVTLTAADGSYLKLAYNTANDLPNVYRNSTTAYDWTNADNLALFKGLNHPPTVSLTGITEGQTFSTGSTLALAANAADTGQRGPIALGWKEGKLSVLANGYLFEETVDNSGNVAWSERAAVAGDYLGAVTRVEFYAGSTLVGTDTDGSDDWSFNWAGLAAGNYALSARAVDNDQEVGWSPVVNIHVAAGPVASAVAPASGPAAGGTSVTVTGSAFATSGQVAVAFGGTPATAVTVASATSLSCRTPAHDPGAVDVVVTNPDALSGTLPGGYTYTMEDWEGDVAPRETGGDGTVSIADWVQCGRFAAELETPAAGLETQKADCALLATNGDGIVGIADWVQTGRYAAKLDPDQAAGGPTERAP